MIILQGERFRIGKFLLFIFVPRLLRSRGRCIGGEGVGTTPVDPPFRLHV